MTMKSLFIRCSEETYNLAHALAKEESRTLNKQIIHMIHKEAKDKEVSAEVNEVSETKEDNSKLGLQGLVETKRQGNLDQQTNS